MSTRKRAASNSEESLRVVSYNVLSSHLCSPSHFIECDPKALDPQRRYTRLTKKLDPEIKAESIICLQEVSMSWCGDLYQHFMSRKYSFVYRLYGSKFNNYMGVGIAFPQTKYVLEKAKIVRASDTKKWPPTEEPSTFQKLLSWGQSWVKEKDLDVWEKSKNKSNCMVLLRLMKKGKVQAGKQSLRFCVGTYHMPCEFRHPSVMVIHAALSAGSAIRFAKELPLIFAGDFNFMPDSAPYKLLTTEDGLTAEDEAAPPPPSNPHDKWSPLRISQALKSAYLEANGVEPNFTNYAMSSMQDEPFAGTLDYIFLSPQVRVQSVDPLPTDTNSFKTPLPTIEEPSDHLLLAADLACPLPDDVKKARNSKDT